MKANVTEDVFSYNTVQRIACTASLHGEYFFYPLTAVNIVLAITALISGKRSDSRRASEEKFPSSTIKIHVPMSGSHRSLCWGFCTTYVCHPVRVCHTSSISTLLHRFEYQ